MNDKNGSFGAEDYLDNNVFFHFIFINYHKCFIYSPTQPETIPYLQTFSIKYQCIKYISMSNQDQLLSIYGYAAIKMVKKRISLVKNKEFDG